MANHEILVYFLGKQVRRPSASNTYDFQTVRIGASNLPISETTGNFDFNAKRLVNIASPLGANDVTTKQYVDAIASGLDLKASCRCATTVNITLSGLQTIDGVSVVALDRVLVKNQTLPAQNGIYDVSAGAWTRAIDFDGNPAGEVSAGAFTFIEEGTTNDGSGWVLTTAGTITVGTTPLSFTQFSGAGQLVAGTGLTKSGNTVNANAGDGLVANADDLAVDATAIAGAGLENDGSNNLRISTAAAGNGLVGGGGSALAVNAGDGIQLVTDQVAVDYSQSFTNTSGLTITARQIVFEPTAGNVQLATASSALDLGSFVGLVAAVSIVNAASGAIYARAGARITGFTGLTVGQPMLISATVAGSFQQNYSGFTAGMHVVSIGKAISTTDIIYEPRYLFEY